MVLTTEVMKKINEFVYIKPRTMEEIAQHIRKNWRTANRYVEKISEEQGTITMRIFREGTRGALKIVYWNNIERIHATSFQEKLFARIENSQNKEDFSPLDIYQYVEEDKRSAFMEHQEDESTTAINKDLTHLLRATEKQIMIFAGSLSWANLTSDGMKTIKIFEELAERNIPIKILTKVNLHSMENVRKFLAINERIGKEMIEIKHREQPLRAIIIDNKIARFKEISDRETGKTGIMRRKKTTFIFYCIYDKEWIEWLQKVFWNLFSNAIPAGKRIKEIETIQNLS